LNNLPSDVEVSKPIQSFLGKKEYRLKILVTLILVVSEITDDGDDDDDDDDDCSVEDKR